LKLEYDEPLSNVAFNFNLRRYAMGERQRIIHVATMGMSGKSALNTYGIRGSNAKHRDMDAKMAACQQLLDEFEELVAVRGEVAISLAGPHSPAHTKPWTTLFLST
jgi:hypothetical protein